MKDKATMMDFELNDGTVVQMTLTFGRLFELRRRKPEAYGKYNVLAMDGIKDELDIITILYTGYLCANIDSLDDCMTEEEFLWKMPENHMLATVVMTRLRVGGKEKKQDSENLS